jgi:hypothetical protein
MNVDDEVGAPPNLHANGPRSTRPLVTLPTLPGDLSTREALGEKSLAMGCGAIVIRKSICLPA